MEIDIQKIKKVHFIGIGGIGISAIARLMNISRKFVSGSDTSVSPVTEQLSTLGIKVFIGHNAVHITSDIDLVVHTIAVSQNNLEIIEARSKNIKIVTYPEMLALISRDMFTIAISGTHGKTTTTAMLANICVNNKLDPTVIVGSLMKDSRSNLIVGKSNYFIVEACEYRRSFLNLYPTILVITNIDTDHLDYYKDLADIQSAFRELVLRIPKFGVIICNAYDPILKPVLEGVECTIIDYTNINMDFTLKIPGIHNRQNASAAYAVAEFLDIEKEGINISLQNFSGTWRRFDFQGKTQNGTLIYDDYAHHPQEIRATLQGLREMYPDKKRVIFFQPHLYSRTKLLLKEFSESFIDADELYILPIYSSRESYDPSINSEILTKIIKGKVEYIETFKKAKKIIERQNKNTVIITMGAGDIYKISKMVKLL